MSNDYARLTLNRLPRETFDRWKILYHQDAAKGGPQSFEKWVVARVETGNALQPR